MDEQQVGRVTHYFDKIGVAVIEVTDQGLSVDDTIHIKGHTTDLTQKIESMQLENQPVEKAEVGQSIGLKVTEPVREHDLVYIVTEEKE